MESYVTSIEYSAFENITIPPLLTVINENVFRNFFSITKITIPSSVETVLEDQLFVDVHLYHK